MPGWNTGVPYAPVDDAADALVGWLGRLASEPAAKAPAARLDGAAPATGGGMVVADVVRAWARARNMPFLPAAAWARPIVRGDAVAVSSLPFAPLPAWIPTPAPSTSSSLARGKGHRQALYLLVMLEADVWRMQATGGPALPSSSRRWRNAGDE